MPFRSMSALCVLLLAGCASSEPQNAAYVPMVEPLAAPAPADNLAFPPQPALVEQTVIPPSEPTAVAALHHPKSRCETRNNVTLCDAPADPAADDTHYTN